MKARTWLVAGAVLVVVVLGGVTAARRESKSSKPTAAPAVEAVASAGCSAGIAPTTAPGANGSTLSFASAGKTGTYFQDVPSVTTPGAPVPVVFDLHGYLEPASLEREGTGLGQEGRLHGFVVITPQIEEGGPARWDFSDGSADLRFLGDLLTHVESTLCIDQRRVFFTGLSMGAFTTSAVACALSDRVAAVATVAGVQNISWCRPSRRVPVVAFHGTADPFVSYDGGPGPAVLGLPAPDGSGRTIGEELAANPNLGASSGGSGSPSGQSIPSQVEAWAKRNGCASKPKEAQVAVDVKLLSYPCPADAAVELYVVAGGGHTWPGSTATFYPAQLVGKTTMSISANLIMWAFFQEHPLRGKLA
jgi:polyhydroxybutyrate depolymerase